MDYVTNDGRPIGFEMAGSMLVIRIAPAAAPVGNLYFGSSKSQTAPSAAW